ncbi:MAG: two component transcriptional regulator, winged helix family [Deltaproteobacteria bacterium]|jgi:two-component system phosphate regulon response regulator PhoB/two-component system alkaline phosphatase synthesis response regulator PhoP|nr:two component transcriptional regulator, winged helix family [Deltaproteobacteria bacterium]
MHKTIAVVDDEQDILELVSLHLKKNHFGVREFSDGSSFIKYLNSEKPDLVVLDLMLPDADGFEICKYMKRKKNLSHIPIVMLTAKSEETDTILGLELGADDYIRKPFSPNELMARIKTVLRRNESRLEVGTPTKISVGNITMDTDRHEVTIDGNKVELTLAEFRILQLLASEEGRVFSRNRILDHLWGNEKIVVDRTIDVHIRHLRSKIGSASKLIRNVHGVGYKLGE